MIKLKIDVTKLDKTRFFKGAKGTYADLVIYENDTPDEYGNDFSVKQDCSKEDRDNGVKMPYIGNGKRIGQKKQEAPPARTTRNIPRAQPQVQEDGTEGDDIPF
jgi:hypothetical protein